MEQANALQETLPFPLSRNRRREETRDSQEALRSMLVQNVSHEFRTPLSIVLGYTELLYDGDLGALEPAQAEALSAVLDNLQTLKTVVERIGILMAIEARFSASMPMDLSEMARRVVQEKRAQAAEKEIELILYVEAELPALVGDPRHMEQAIDSLIENALKFTPTGGRVEVALSSEGDEVCLAVTDTGIGIAAHEVERIFSGFYQVDGSTTRRHGGLGLGLTLVEAVVQEQGGQIEVESRLGQGTRFRLRLPAGRRKQRWVSLSSAWQVGRPI